MKTSFRPRRRIGAGVAIFFALCALGVLGVSVLSDAPRSLVRKSALFAYALGERMSEYTATQKALVRENDALRAELIEANTVVLESAAIREELELYRAVAGSSSEILPFVAPVLAAPLFTPYDTFVVGAGTSQGVRAGDFVLNGEFVVGKVRDVREATALVREIFAPGEKLQALLGDARIDLEGRGGGMARALVPASLVVAEGDLLFLSEASGRPIGVVAATEDHPADVYKTLHVRAPHLGSTLRFVLLAHAQ
jgi:cell shape-determining protein MreC